MSSTSTKSNTPVTVNYNKTNVDNQQYGYKEEDRSQIRKIRLLKQLLLPFLYYDLSTNAGRRQYCDLITEDPLSGLLTWLPFIILMVLVNVHTAIALWTAAGLSVGTVAFDYYHATYKPQYPKFYWLSWTFVISFIGLGVAYTVHPFEYMLVSPISNSCLFITVIISLLVGRPFTTQMVQHKIPEEILHSASFRKMSVVLTFVWVFIFAVVAGCSWGAYALGTSASKIVNLFLNTIIPLVFIFTGIAIMPHLGKMLRDRFETTQQSKSNGENNQKQVKSDEKTEVSIDVV